MPSTTFDEVLDAIEHLPIEQQADLVDVVRRRLAERGRQQIIADARARPAPNLPQVKLAQHRSMT
jgi:hypothetical protein